MTETAMNRYRYLRGLLAIWVVLGHCCMYTDVEFPILEEMQEFNLFCVGVFFFQSGYGLCRGLDQRKDYLRGFLLKKPLRLFLLAVIAGIVNVLIQLSLGKTYDSVYYLAKSVREFINWYIWVQVLFYFLFFLAAKLIKKDGVRLILMTIAVLISMEMFRHTDLGFAYYTSGLGRKRA